MKAIVLSLLIVGCGVKTSPRSTIIEARPAIPFKDTVSNKASNSENPQSPEQDIQPEEEHPQGEQTYGTQR